MLKQNESLLCSEMVHRTSLSWRDLVKMMDYWSFSCDFAGLSAAASC